MLIYITFASMVLCEVFSSEGNKFRPYVFPVPFELPNRNDRSDQCWLRVEDTDVTETVTVYCYIAREYLRGFIWDYNSKKMSQDGVEVTPWGEQPRNQDDIRVPSENSSIQDWRVTTVLDPITHLRLYVTKNAYCRLIMYSREGMTNYQVDCGSVLYFINDRMSGSAVKRPEFLLLSVSLCLVFMLLRR